jgi:uncharacterized protein YajQ (UPF0234 family)
MPSFDVVSEVDRQEIDNAINQARKELATRFDFRGSTASIEVEKFEKIKLGAEEGSKLKGLLEIVINKLAKREIDLRNIERKDPEISSMGRATQELVVVQGIEGTKAKEIIAVIKASGIKVQSSLQERQVRVTGKNRDDLQAVIRLLREKDFGIGLAFKNFRD